MSVKLECANVVLKDNEGNSGVVRTLSDADVVKVNGALADISDLQTRVKTVEDNGYVSYNGMQMLSETQREQAQANIDAPGLSVNNTFTGKITVESDVKADSFTLNTKSDYASLSASTNTYGITLKGGSSAGASLDLRGSTDTDAPNEFKLASGSVDLNGKSDGSLTWNSENVVRKVNNLPADANGNVLLGTEKSTFNKVVYDTGYFSVGTGATYAFDLTGTDLENVSKENVNIRLVAKVVTAHDGFAVGDIAVLSSTIDHTVNEDIDVATYIRGNTLYVYSGNSTVFSIRNVTGWLRKAHVQIKAVLTAFIPDDGSILLIAEDQTNSCSLVGLPDGTLTWGGAPIVPTGTVIPFAGSVIPNGYLLCNGAAVSRTDYSRLFEVIGTTYGSGDGSTTFKLPDLRDRFVEGAGTNKLATYLEAGLPNITGTFRSALNHYRTKSLNDDELVSGVYTINRTHADVHETGTTGVMDTSVTMDASLANVIYGNSDTVQPNTLVLNYIIKY
jgi:microcystin-dependent protein